MRGARTDVLARCEARDDRSERPEAELLTGKPGQHLGSAAKANPAERPEGMRRLEQMFFLRFAEAQRPCEADGHSEGRNGASFLRPSAATVKADNDERSGGKRCRQFQDKKR
jgi:hypothetical protein